MRDLSITCRKIIITTMKVPTDDGGEVDRQVEIVINAPNVPQSLRVMMAYTALEAANDFMCLALDAATTINEDGYYEHKVGEDGKKIRLRKKLTLDEGRAINEKIALAEKEVMDAELALDIKRREFHKTCFSFITQVRMPESKRPVLFDFGWERPKTWDEMDDDDKEVLCTYDNTIAINPIFQALRSGASVEELGK